MSYKEFKWGAVI